MPIAHIIMTSMEFTSAGDPTRLPIICTLIEDSNRLMLFDTGFWGNGDLSRALDRLGMSPGDVSHVFLTHFHADHAGGVPLFPNAVKIAARKEYDFSRRWLQKFSDARDRCRYITEQFPYLPLSIVKETTGMLSDHMEFIPRSWWDDTMEGYLWLENTPDIARGVEAIPTPGHTPHHTSYRITGSQGIITVSGDAISRRGNLQQEVPLDEPHLDLSAYRRSMETLLSIPACIIPAHDRPFLSDGCRLRPGKRITF